MAKLPKIPNYGVSKIGNRLVFDTRGFVPGSMGRGDVSGWSKGVSKPFGSQFKPKRPNEDKRIQSEPSLSYPITSKAEVHPIEGKPIVGPVEITYNPGTKYDPAEVMERRVAALIAVRGKLVDFQQTRIKKKAKQPKPEPMPKEMRINGYKPGFVGLDASRRVKPEPKPTWEREKEDASNLFLYWMELRAIYRLIYS